jgi:hypothetical protein
MTALAFIFGCLPLWTASGAGGASRRILGTVVVGGTCSLDRHRPHLYPRHLLRGRIPVASLRRGGKGTTMDSKGDLAPVAAKAAPPEADPGPTRPEEVRHEQLSGLFSANVCSHRLPPCCWLAAAGCTVGPKYSGQPILRRLLFAAPTMPPSQRRPGFARRSSNGPQVYREPELQDLIAKRSQQLRSAHRGAAHSGATGAGQITRSQQFPTVSVGGTGIGATLPRFNLAQTQIGSPLVDGSFSLSPHGRPTSGALSQADRSGARTVAGANLGAARGAPDAGAGSCDHLSSTARARSPA